MCSIHFKDVHIFFDFFEARAHLALDDIDACFDVLRSIQEVTSRDDVIAQVHTLAGDCFSKQVYAVIVLYIWNSRST